MSTVWERVNLAIRATRKLAAKTKGELKEALADDRSGSWVEHLDEHVRRVDRDLLLLGALRDLDLRLQALERKLEGKGTP